MANSALFIVFILLVSLLPLPVESSEYLLFSPGPLEGELLVPQRGKGVLVRRITIKPGDTLSSISQDFSGRSSYFPQILLFNDIRNPDLILAGRELIVPVSKQSALSKTSTSENKLSPAVKKSSLAKPKPAGVTGDKSNSGTEKSQRRSAGKMAPKIQEPTGAQSNKKEQDAYSTAISAYRREEYKQSLSLFSRFLAMYPSSSLAADASLYKAECLFKLSGQ